MKTKILAILLGSVISTHSFAQTPPKVFISAVVEVIDGCNYNRFGSFGPDTIKEWVRANLQKTGYAIANSRSEATNGLEANIVITWCGTLVGGAENQSASIRWAAISRGSSVVSPKTKEVPFNYAGQLAVSAGEPSARHAEQLITYLKTYVDGYVSRLGASRKAWHTGGTAVV